MADGRIIAHGTSDTATGAFTCVVRRTSLLDRLRYRVRFENNCNAVADVVLSRGDAALQTLFVPAHSQVDATFTFASGTTVAAIVVDIRCDGTTMRVVERSPAARPNDTGDTRRLVVLSAFAAALAAGGVVAAAVLVWRFLVWRRRRLRPDRYVEPPAAESPAAAPPVNDPEPVVAPAPLAIANDEPMETNLDLDLDADPDQMSYVQVLDPEPIRPRTQERATAGGVTYDGRSVQRSTPSATLLAIPVAFGVLAGGFVLIHPHIGELGVPNAVLQGSAIDVPYTSSGFGTLGYRVTAADGTIVDGGELTQRSGTLHIPIPVSHNDVAYRIRLSLAGPLGDASNEATISAHAVPQARIITRTPVVPNIRSFAVTRSTVNDASSIVAFYDVLADRGTIRLVDTRGIQYGLEPLNASGEARFPLPDGIDAGTLAVELHAVRAGVTADSRIALPSGSDSLAVAEEAPGSQAPLGSEGVPIIVPTTSVGTGPIRVRILHHYEDLHVALVDGNERKIVGVAVPSNSRVITLSHPPVAVATRVTVQATYRVNNESDTVIRPVILVPDGG
jgi:hypothetical protein